ncbi:type II toxin-antitoxin system HicB family antitoxin [Listeria booriae]|uniref:type II toxin-antitoxin system HicB family antitoxin n=1 Tax=Listeria booriae TaxID=1552123 RepID=UPI0016278710|nr:type II toxin-antitoxin system HicB family antitoxin [Listeria booriae]MBC1212432.1 hypothetical protein [Listeria booriae]MBC1309306.1 hypothetical protein [Listeria booriae]
MTTYLYPFFAKKKEKSYQISFPDFPEVITSADSLEVVYTEAIRALSQHVYNLLVNEEAMPAASLWESLDTPPKSMAFLASIDRVEVLATFGNKPVKKMISIPTWMSIRAEKNSLSLSKVLQQALKERFEK